MWLALIGMSGIGKSYWSGVLARHGFQRFDCDQLISETVGQELALPFESFADLDRWIGVPTEPTFNQRNAIYARHETAVMERIITTLEQSDPETTPRVVIDTAGSVIYIPPVLWTRLRRLVRIVHLAAPANVLEELLPAFLADPRPVIWNGLFEPLPDEPIEATYRRCYPLLVQQRTAMYQHYRDQALDYRIHRQPNLTATAFLQLLTA